MISEKQKEKVWSFAKKIHGKNPKMYRQDPYGNIIYKRSYGKSSAMGWEIDHIKPVSRGGSDAILNLQAVSVLVNRQKHDFQIAISYSREDSSIARQITHALKMRGLQVYFDEYMKSDYWGRDFYRHLTRIYEQSRLCIIIVSESYSNSQWTISEFRNLLSHSQLRDSYDILPVVIGKAPTSILGRIDYVDWRSTSAKRIATMVEKRLLSLPPPSGKPEPESYHVIRRESEWSVKRGGASRATSIHNTQEEAITAARRIASKHCPSELVIHRKDGTIESRELIKPEKHNADSDS